MPKIRSGNKVAIPTELLELSTNPFKEGEKIAICHYENDNKLLLLKLTADFSDLYVVGVQKFSKGHIMLPDEALAIIDASFGEMVAIELHKGILVIS